jgi:hypothetical protein
MLGKLNMEMGWRMIVPVKDDPHPFDDGDSRHWYTPPAKI